MYRVNLLICSNGINTASGLYKIFIQIFAVIAEFERDTLTERIVDNMMELAKDGRWLGGNTPMGFTVRRVTTGSGKGKSAYSYLESLPEEKRMVQRLYEIFRTTRSIQTTAKQMNEEGFHTPSGAAFNASTTRLVLRNPIYCTADKRNDNYFIEHDGNVFGDMTEFDGTHGLSAYNKTDQEKYEALTAHSSLQNMFRPLKASLLVSGLLRSEGMKALFQVNNGLKCRNFWMLLQRNTIALTERPTHCWQDWCIVLTAAGD